MTVWRPITAKEVGYGYVISEAIAIAEAANPGLLWPVDKGLQIVASDYSGQHRQATHQAYSFLITTDQALADWLPLWAAFRSERLPDGRRLSFKQLREPVRRRAYPHFLDLVGRMRANLITFMVDNRVGDLCGDPIELAAIWDDCFVPGATAASIEKAYRLALFVCLVQAGLRREDQASRWISDQDEVLDSFDKRERFAGVARYLAFGMTGWRAAAVQECMTTGVANSPAWLEDMAAIPDIAAGACAQLSGALPLFRNQRNWVVPIPYGDAVDGRARLFGDWLSTSHGVLRHVLVRLAPDDTGVVRASAQQFVRRSEWNPDA
jgi:hypothetical protein